MAGNTRGRLKERFEGVHRNFDWSKQHCEAAIELVKDHKPELTQSIESLIKGIDILDELAQGIYGKL